MQLHMERGQQLDPAVMERALKAMFGLEGFVARSGLEKSLLDLVRLRASQLNGCANCINMHTRDARARGESEQRLCGHHRHQRLEPGQHRLPHRARQLPAGWVAADRALAAEHRDFPVVQTV